MTYWRYWKLSSSPFASDAPLYRGASVEEALARIEFLVGNCRSVGSLLGASGVGKSTLLRHCALNPFSGDDMPDLMMLKTTMLGLSEGDLLVELATRLSGSRRVESARSAWNTLCDTFQAANREGIQTVLLVDDTESSTAAAEADLCRLLSMRLPLTIVFSVESHLASAVSRNLFDRSELQIELPAWDIAQTEEFFAWSFHRLGRSQPIFTQAALERIQQLSEGIVRRMVQLADLSLVAGAVAQLEAIDEECVDQVAWELPKSVAA